MSALSSFRPARLARRRGVPLPKLHVPISAYVVDCAVYVDGVRLPGRWTHDRALAEVRRRERRASSGSACTSPTRSRSRASPTCSGCTSWPSRTRCTRTSGPKLERYDDTLFMVLKTVCYVGHAQPTTANEIVETGEIMVFLGPDFVITVRHGEHSVAAAGAAQAGGRPGAAGAGPGRGAARDRRPRGRLLPRGHRGRSRTTSTRWRPRSSRPARRWTPSRST